MLNKIIEWAAVFLTAAIFLGCVLLLIVGDFK